MHQTTIRPEDFTILQERLAIFGRSDTGTAQVTVGKHPDLGSVVVTCMAGDRLLLWSEQPYREPKHLGETISAAA